MGIPATNILISTQRSSFNSGTGATNAAAAKLTNVPGHIRSTAGQLHTLPASALTAEYEVRVDSGTDIRKGDWVTAITLVDGHTTWPGLSLATTPITNETWQVLDAVEATPMTLPYRRIFLRREVGGGPSY